MYVVRLTKFGASYKFKEFDVNAWYYKYFCINILCLCQLDICTKSIPAQYSKTSFVYVYMQGASQVDQAILPVGSEQVFVMSQNISNSIKEDLAWGTYIVLRNTNTVSVVSARFHKIWLDLKRLWLFAKIFYTNDYLYI